MIEMLLQSHEGALDLLPALPTDWPAGRVSGLRARGGFTVDLEWAAGEVTRAAVSARHGGVCRVKARQPLTVTCAGRPVAVTAPAAGTIAFETRAGLRYELRP
jgi:alpha-L-fucosidase 2